MRVTARRSARSVWSRSIKRWLSRDRTLLTTTPPRRSRRCAARHKFHVVCVHRRRQTHPLPLRSARWKRSRCVPPARSGARSCAEDACSERPYAKGGTPPSAERALPATFGRGRSRRSARHAGAHACDQGIDAELGFRPSCWLGRSSAGLCARSLSDTGSDLSVEEEIRRIDERLHSGGDEGVAALRRLDEILELAREHFRAEYIVGRTPVELETERLHLPSGLPRTRPRCDRGHDAGPLLRPEGEGLMGGDPPAMVPDDAHSRCRSSPRARGRWLSEPVHRPARARATEFDGAVGRALMQANLLTEKHFHYPVLFDDGRSPLLKETNLSLVDDRHRKALAGVSEGGEDTREYARSQHSRSRRRRREHGDAASAEARARRLGFAVGLPVEAREFELFARAAKAARRASGSAAAARGLQGSGRGACGSARRRARGAARGGAPGLDR